MYRQEKKYVILAKNGEKLTNAGLRKITLTDQKIRVEFFLSSLPLHYGVTMECVIRYRCKGEVVSTKSWKNTLEKNNSHYIFSMKTPEYIEEIVDCCILLQGKEMIVSDQALLSAELLEQRKEPDRASVRSEAREITRNIEYIRDLDYLREGNDELQKLYYNSFLLHGFYQYRYFILGNDFIGVPDHFYEREAIAARMMGFPYFMEAEFVENCNLAEGTRNELPKQGCFGYYLKKINKGT